MTTPAPPSLEAGPTRGSITNSTDLASSAKGPLLGINSSHGAQGPLLGVSRSHGTFLGDEAIDQKEQGLVLFTQFHKEPPGSQMCKDIHTLPMMDKEGREPTEEEINGEEGLRSWQIADRVDGMTDLATPTMAKRSVWTKIGFKSRNLFIAYVFTALIFVGGLSSYLAIGQRGSSATCSKFTKSLCNPKGADPGSTPVDRPWTLKCQPEGGEINVCNTTVDDESMDKDYLLSFAPKADEEYCCPLRCCQKRATATITFNSQDDYQTVVISLIVGVGLLPVMYWIFMVLRRKFPYTYNSKQLLTSRANETKKRVSFAVLYVEFQARLFDPDADRLIQQTGLDGWMLLRFYTMGARICSTLGIAVLVVLSPIHVILGRKEGVDPLSRFSLNSIKYAVDNVTVDDDGNSTFVEAANSFDDYWNDLEAQKLLFWAHCIMVWVVVQVTAQTLITAQTRFLAYRYGWLSALPRPRATTVIIDNIPKLYRSDELLHNFFSSIFPREAISKTYIVRRPDQVDLTSKYNKMKAAQDKLSLVVEKWKREGSDPDKRPQVNEMERIFKRLGNAVTGKAGQSVETDAIRRYTSDLMEVRKVFVEAQQELEDMARQGKVSVYGRTGFITFSSRKWQALALDRRYRADGRQLACEMPPDPLDVVWTDLASSKRSSYAKLVLGYVFLFGLFVFGLPLFSIIANFMNSEGFLNAGQYLTARDSDWFAWLATALTDLGNWLTNKPTGRFIDALLKGPGNALLFQTMVALVPVMLFYPLQIISHLRTNTNLNIIVQSWYFAFQMMFLVFGAVLGKGLYDFWDDLQTDPQKIFEAFESDLPQSTNFFLNLAITSWAGLMVHLCRPIALGKYFLFRPMLGQLDAAVRAQVEDPAFFGTGVRMCKATVQLSLFLIFGLMQPLISLPLLVFFIVARSVYRELMIKAEDKRPDTGGLHWVNAMDQLWITLYLFVTTMGIILWRRAPTTPALLTYLAGIYLLRKHLEYRSLEWRFLPLEKVVELDIASEQVLSQVGFSEFVQDECKVHKETREEIEMKIDMGRNLGKPNSAEELT